MTTRPIDASSRFAAAMRQARQPDLLDQDRDEPASDAGATGRALVPLVTARDAPPRPAGRNIASFLAQLIATNRGLPQTRDRRRAEPDEARAAYRETQLTSAGAAPRRLARIA